LNLDGNYSGSSVAEPVQTETPESQSATETDSEKKDNV